MQGDTLITESAWPGRGVKQKPKWKVSPTLTAIPFYGCECGVQDVCVSGAMSIQSVFLGQVQQISRPSAEKQFRIISVYVFNRLTFAGDNDWKEKERKGRRMKRDIWQDFRQHFAVIAEESDKHALHVVITAVVAPVGFR